MTNYQPFRKHKNYYLAILILVLAFALSFSSLRDLFGVRGLLLSAVYPFQHLTFGLWKGMIGFPSAVINLRGLGDENTALKEKLSSLQTKLSLLDEIARENERLRRGIGFQDHNRYGFRLLPAQVIGKGASPWFSIVEIDRGENAGVRADMPVVVEEGLVGRVIEVSRFSSKVLLVTDPASSIAAVDQKSRDFGVVDGYAPETLIMKYVSSGGSPQAGDKVVTAAASSVFPPGIPIGTITRAEKKEHDLFYQIEVKPLVRFSELEEVFLVI